MDLFVGQAVHQATISVGEQGTVAEAVTEIGLSGTSAPLGPEHQFIADRPFLMIVQENITGGTCPDRHAQHQLNPHPRRGEADARLNDHAPNTGYKLGYARITNSGIAHPIDDPAPAREVDSIPRPAGGGWPVSR